MVFIGETRCEDGNVQFGGGPNEYEGRVELCKSGRWVQVCANDGWGIRHVGAVCKQVSNSECLVYIYTRAGYHKSLCYHIIHCMYFQLFISAEMSTVATTVQMVFRRVLSTLQSSVILEDRSISVLAKYTIKDVTIVLYQLRAQVGKCLYLSISQLSLTTTIDILTI